MYEHLSDDAFYGYADDIEAALHNVLEHIEFDTEDEFDEAAATVAIEFFEGKGYSTKAIAHFLMRKHLMMGRRMMERQRAIKAYVVMPNNSFTISTYNEFEP